MAQLEKKYVIIAAIFGVAFCLLVVLLLMPFSSVQTNDNKNYLVSVNGEKYSSKLNLKKGEYVIYIQTPFNTETETIKLGFFDNKVIDVSEHQSEGGPDQVAQKLMVNAGFPGTEINNCTNIVNYHYVCESYQLSSIRAVEIIYNEGQWKMNLNPESAENIQSKTLMESINANNNQR